MQDNSALLGGAIAVSDSNLRLNNARLLLNRAQASASAGCSNSGGAAVACVKTANASISAVGTTFANNTAVGASSEGGAILSQACAVSLATCTLQFNEAVCSANFACRAKMLV